MQNISLSSILSLFKYVSCFFLKPKIQISFDSGNAGSSSGVGNCLTLKWDYRLTLYNLTKHDAMEVEFIYTNALTSIILPENHIRGLTTVIIRGQLEKLIDRDIVIQARHDFLGRAISRRA